MIKYTLLFLLVCLASIGLYQWYGWTTTHYDHISPRFTWRDVRILIMVMASVHTIIYTIHTVSSEDTAFFPTANKEALKIFVPHVLSFIFTPLTWFVLIWGTLHVAAIPFTCIGVAYIVAGGIVGGIGIDKNEFYTVFGIGYFLMSLTKSIQARFIHETRFIATLTNYENRVKNENYETINYS